MTIDWKPTEGDQLREQAIRQWKKRRDFRVHATIYIMVNAFLVTIWAMSGVGFFWPILVLVGWGIGLVANAFDAHSSDVPSEEEIARQMDRLRRRS